MADNRSYSAHMYEDSEIRFFSLLYNINAHVLNANSINLPRHKTKIPDMQLCSLFSLHCFNHHVIPIQSGWGD